MDPFTQSRELLYFLAAHTGQEAVRYIREEMRQAAPGRIPTAWELHRYFQFPDRPTALTAWQQILAVDKLLEYAEINLRTLCDLLRYRQLKGFGVVHSVDEFTALCHPHAKESEEYSDLITQTMTNYPCFSMQNWCPRRWALRPPAPMS